MNVKALLKKVGAPAGKYDLDQVEDGIEVELEHCNPGKSYKDMCSGETDALRIALAHLDEIPDYYERLEEMEKAAKKRNKKTALLALKGEDED
jgi:hypothetical protein